MSNDRWRATLENMNDYTHVLRSKGHSDLKRLVETYWLAYNISHNVWQGLLVGQKIDFTGFGSIRVEKEADDAERKVPCGGCEPCKYSKYDDDDTETHCIDCTCFLCIPGA